MQNEAEMTSSAILLRSNKIERNPLPGNKDQNCLQYPAHNGGGRKGDSNKGCLFKLFLLIPWEVALREIEGLTP